MLNEEQIQILKDLYPVGIQASAYKHLDKILGIAVKKGPVIVASDMENWNEIKPKIEELLAKGLRPREIVKKMNEEGTPITNRQVYQLGYRTKSYKSDTTKPTPPQNEPVKTITHLEASIPEKVTPGQDEKSISRASLEGRIHDMFVLEKLTPKQISEKLYADGLYYSQKTVETRLVKMELM
jgi:hypothetical protein